MKTHLVQGDAGCAFARAHHCVAVVVDALRASATAAMLLQSGARELLVVREVEEARALKERFPDALLCGERGGVPPEGFDYGNSPVLYPAAMDRTVLFTTTTGAQRLISCWGAAAVVMGTTVNARAAAGVATRLARTNNTDIVLIPAGLATDETFSAQEDWVGATAVAALIDAEVASGAEAFAYWRERIRREGIAGLFEEAPHAEKLRQAGLAEDIARSAQMDITAAVPVAVERTPMGVICKEAGTNLLNKGKHGLHTSGDGQTAR